MEIKWNEANQSKVLLDGVCPACGKSLVMSVARNRPYWCVETEECCGIGYVFYPRTDSFIMTQNNEVEMVVVAPDNLNL